MYPSLTQNHVNCDYMAKRLLTYQINPSFPGWRIIFISLLHLLHFLVLASNLWRCNHLINCSFFLAPRFFFPVKLWKDNVMLMLPLSPTEFHLFSPSKISRSARNLVSTVLPVVLLRVRDSLINFASLKGLTHTFWRHRRNTVNLN